MIIRRTIWIAALLIGLVLATGLQKAGGIRQYSSVFPLAGLIAGETCKLKVICNVEARQASR